MRRDEREIADVNSIAALMKTCSVCSLALPGEDFPYVIPVNFGVQEENGRTKFDFERSAVEKTTVLRLTAEQITGKVNKKPN